MYFKCSKLKYPEIYRVFKYLRKLYYLYGDIENSEKIRFSVEPKDVIATERKLKSIFEKHEDLYRSYLYPSQEDDEHGAENEMAYLEYLSGFIDKKSNDKNA